jgi:hypothetical protein
VNRSYGFTYNGSWKEGIINGQGQMVYVNNSIYIGEFKEGFRDGKGTFIYNDKDLYTTGANKSIAA